MAEKIIGRLLSPVSESDGSRTDINLVTSTDAIIDDDGKVLTDTLSKVDERLENLEYVPVKITGFVNSVGVSEKGSTVSSINLTWTTNITPSGLTLDGVDQVIDGNSGVITLASPITDNKTWTLVAKDAKGNTDTAVTTAEFSNRICYGVSEAPANVNSNFVMGLSNFVMSSEKERTVTFTPGVNQYIYYAVPVSLGDCTFKVDGFDGGFEPAVVATVTNTSGYSEDYNVYRSTNPNLGKTEVVIY